MTGPRKQAADLALLAAVTAVNEELLTCPSCHVRRDPADVARLLDQLQELRPERPA